MHRGKIRKRMRSNSYLEAVHVKQKEAVGEQLRFGIDIDGTITQAPSHFKRLIDAMQQGGHYVAIITARDDGRRAETEELLQLLGISYDELIMKPIEWPGTVPEFKVLAVREYDVQLMFDDEEPNCWAIQQQTQCLTAHALPIPELQQEYLDLLEAYDLRVARARGLEIDEEEEKQVELNIRGA